MSNAGEMKFLGINNLESMAHSNAVDFVQDAVEGVGDFIQDEIIDPVVDNVIEPVVDGVFGDGTTQTISNTVFQPIGEFAGNALDVVFDVQDILLTPLTFPADVLIGGVPFAAGEAVGNVGEFFDSAGNLLSSAPNAILASTGLPLAAQLIFGDDGEVVGVESNAVAPDEQPAQPDQPGAQPGVAAAAQGFDIDGDGDIDVITNAQGEVVFDDTGIEGNNITGVAPQPAEFDTDGDGIADTDANGNPLETPEVGGEVNAGTPTENGIGEFGGIVQVDTNNDGITDITVVNDGTNTQSFVDTDGDGLVDEVYFNGENVTDQVIPSGAQVAPDAAPAPVPTPAPVTPDPVDATPAPVPTPAPEPDPAPTEGELRSNLESSENALGAFEEERMDDNGEVDISPADRGEYNELIGNVIDDQTALADNLHAQGRHDEAGDHRQAAADLEENIIPAQATPTPTPVVSEFDQTLDTVLEQGARIVDNQDAIMYANGNQMLADLDNQGQLGDALEANGYTLDEDGNITGYPTDATTPELAELRESLEAAYEAHRSDEPLTTAEATAIIERIDTSADAHRENEANPGIDWESYAQSTGIAIVDGSPFEIDLSDPQPIMSDGPFSAAASGLAETPNVAPITQPSPAAFEPA